MEKLPSELVGEILCRLPTKSLCRSRAVSKPWKAFWEDKNFWTNYLARARPQFIIRSNSQICCVDMINLDDDDDDPIIEVRDVNLDLACNNSLLVHCDGFLLSDMGKKGFAVWNPWLTTQKRCIEKIQEYRFCGVGYDKNRPEAGYKILGFDFKLYPKVAIYECKSDAFKFIINAPGEEEWRVPQLDTIVSLTGNLYWISYHSPTCEYFIRSFDFAKEIFKTFCLLPAANEEDFGYTQVLAVFKGDGLSVLRQSYLTGKIEILVTSQKIDGNENGNVVWITFMTVSIPNIPRLQRKCLDSQPSYFVDDNRRLFLCTCDETGHACIYIYIANTHVFKKIPIDSMGLPLWPTHLTYIPSFAPIPFEQQV